MKNLLKSFLVTACVITILVISTVALLPVLVNVQNHVPAIEQQITKLTGRACSLGSDIQVRLLPKISISFSDFSLGNPEGFSQQLLLSIDSGTIQLNLWKLLSGQFVVERCAFSGVTAYFQENILGAKNWNTFSFRNHQLFDIWNSNGGGGIFAVADTHLVWESAIAHRRYELTEVTFVATKENDTQPFTFEALGNLNNLPFSIAGNLLPVQQEQQPTDVDIPSIFRVIASTDFIAESSTIASAGTIRSALQGDLSGDVVVSSGELLLSWIPVEPAADDMENGVERTIFRPLQVRGTIMNPQFFMDNQEVSIDGGSGGQYGATTQQKLSPELEEVVLRLAGQAIIDPALVAQQFASEAIATEKKKKGTVRIATMKIE